MQFAKELLNQAVAKGQQLQNQLQAVASSEALAQARARNGARTSSGSVEGSSQGGTSLNALSAPAEVKVLRLKQELAASRINIDGLKRIALHGVPDSEPALRAVVWKVILGYLPPSPDEWAQYLARRRTEYHVFCDELIIDPKKPMQAELDAANAVAASPARSGAHPDTSPLGPPPTGQQGQASAGSTDPLAPQQLAGQDVTSVDHPLSLDAGSRWNTFFQDSETLEQITRDVVRTHPDMHFFTGDTEEAELHRQEMRRALFMYAKLNPGLRYIQGMNELIAPLYWLFKNDPDPIAAQYAEADAFWCFMELVSEFRDHFCAQLDNAQTGIRATIRRLMQVLQHHDYKLWQHIEIECKVDPQYYAFRWITLLLSQEFAFPDTLRIWDTILSDPHGRMDCLLRVCTAMILNVHDRLMAGDFTVIMKTLQRYPPVDVTVLLRLAASMPPCNEVLGAPV